MEKHIEILKERFLNDSLMALATIDDINALKKLLEYYKKGLIKCK